jgi:3-phosphoshikimate 1-carboxyvinyltransferase
MKRMGVAIEVAPDGFHIPGKQKFKGGATCDSFHDHRIAMAFAIAGLAADGPTLIDRADAASVSFPEFYSTIEHLSS